MRVRCNQTVLAYRYRFLSASSLPQTSGDITCKTSKEVENYFSCKNSWHKTTCFPAQWQGSFLPYWKTCTLLSLATATSLLLLLPSSKWDQHLWTPAHQADGKAKRLSWGFWLKTSNFLGGCQHTALSVLVGSAALTGWIKTQASKAQLLVYSQRPCNLITTRTKSAFQGQTLLLDKHRVTQTAWYLNVCAANQPKHVLTEKESLPPTWHNIEK